MPELAKVPSPHIFEPWKLSLRDQERYGVIIGDMYPAPIDTAVGAPDGPGGGKGVSGGWVGGGPSPRAEGAPRGGGGGGGAKVMGGAPRGGGGGTEGGDGKRRKGGSTGDIAMPPRGGGGGESGGGGAAAGAGGGRDPVKPSRRGQQRIQHL